MALVYYGMQRRHEDATMVHAHSSRSHLIVQLTIYTITKAKPSTSSASSDAAPSPPGTPTRSRRTLPTPSAGHSSRSQSPAPRSKAAAARRSRWVWFFLYCLFVVCLFTSQRFFSFCKLEQFQKICYFINRKRSCTQKFGFINGC